MKFLSQINVNSNYALPAVDGNTGQVLTTDGEGNAYWGTITISSASLNSLNDVAITNPSSGQVLTYGIQPGESVASWHNKTPPYLTTSSSIGALGDVSIGTKAVGNLLRWNGSNWVNWAPNFLTSYTETDPIYTASSWYTTTNNASNWDTAYGWGNHSGLYANAVHTHSVFTQAQNSSGSSKDGSELDFNVVPGQNGFVPASGIDDGGKFLRGDGTWQIVTTDLTGYATETWVGQRGYLTSYTETDPVFKGSAAYGISTENISGWNTMIEWGNHADAGYLKSYAETDPIYTGSSWYTTTNNSTNWNTAYGWGNHAGLYIARVLNHTQGYHLYAYPNPENWHKIAKVVLNGNCQSMNLFGEYRDLSYYLNTAYKIHITARAECDFLSNNESHTIRVNIVTTSTNKTGFGDKVRVVLTRQEDGVREYELQYYRTTWDAGRWELQGDGWTIYDTSQTAGTALESEHIVYNSNVVASNFYGDNVYIKGYAAATQAWVGSQGYLTSYTETDPIYTASSWYTTTNNSGNWDTAHGWGNHAGLYIPINPDGDGAAWAYSDENPTINGTSIGGRQSFGADGDSLTGGALQARLLNAYEGHVNSTYGYYVGSLNYGGDSGTHTTTQVINSAGTFVGPQVSTGKIYGSKLLMGSGTDENAVGNGGIRIGRTDTNYTHGSSWSGTSSTMFIDCSDVATITIHDSGHRLVEYMTYDGAGTNTIFTGRNIGWGTTNWSFGGDVSITGSLSASGYNKSNWDTAYGWGDHATANYWVTSNPDPQKVAAESVTFQYDVEIQGQLLETSSIRFKENIVDLEPVGDKVSQLRPVRYNKIGSEAQEIGLIAEEVAELFPEVVHYNEDGEAESLNYTRLSVLLLQTVKELSDRIQKLENK